MCENLDTLDEPEAKAAMIWIIGEYAEKIENADELLEIFVENFQDEDPQVQLQLLTATVKLFLKRPTDTQELVQRVLNLATEESDNPDLRDRGYVYWRLLSADPVAAKAVVLSSKPTISDDSVNLSASLLDELINNLSSLSSIYHKLPAMFVPDFKVKKKEKDTDESEDNSEEGEEEGEEEAEDGAEDGAEDAEDNVDSSEAENAQASKPNLLINMDGMNVKKPQETEQKQPVETTEVSLEDLFGGGSSAPSDPSDLSDPSEPKVEKQMILTRERGNGLQISARFFIESNQMYMEMLFENFSSSPIPQALFQFNKNTCVQYSVIGQLTDFSIDLELFLQ